MSGGGTTPPGAGHAAVGTGLFSAPHASGYEHPATGVTIDAVSPASNHPLIELAVTVALAAKGEGGSVIGPRVDVYVDRIRLALRC